MVVDWWDFNGPMKRKFKKIEDEEEEVVEAKKTKQLKLITDDILYYTFQFMNDFEINIIRFTCKRFLKISNYPNIWKTINLPKICLYKNILSRNLSENQILLFFNSINTQSIESISFKNCRKMRIETLIKILKICPNLKQISLILCQISISDYIFYFNKENNFLKKLKEIELGIILIDPNNELLYLENILKKKNIETDCTICLNCNDRLLLKSLCCSFCKKKYCLGCSFTFFCSFCFVWECNECSQGWIDCDICSRTCCKRCNQITLCSFCEKSTCQDHCDCMFVE